MTRTDPDSVPALAAIARAMGGSLAQSVRIEPEHTSPSRLIILLPASQIFLEVRTPYHAPGRFEFAAYVATQTRERIIYLDTRKTATVTVDRHRPPTAIAADLARRLLSPAVHATARAYLAEERAAANEKAAHAIALDTLADAMGAPFIRQPSGYQDHWRARNCRIADYEVREMAKGQAVTIELDIANPGALLAILRLARADFELAASQNPA